MEVKQQINGYGKCIAAWDGGRVPDDWTMVVIVPLDECKGSKSDCKAHRGIIPFMIPGKVHGRTVTDRTKTDYWIVGRWESRWIQRGEMWSPCVST